MSSDSKPVKAQWVKDMEAEAGVGRAVMSLLFPYAGEGGRNEGAVETLRRLLGELNTRREIAPPKVPRLEAE